MNRILVTGAAGFTGQHLCRYLARHGYEVTGTYHRARLLRTKELNLVPLDITRFSEVDDLIRRLKPRWVCHLAAQSVPRLSWHRQEETLKTNVVGTLHLLDALRRHAPETLFLYASSIQVYGRAFREGKPVSEETIPWPENPYAVSKVLAEHACLDFHARFGIPVIIARPFNHVGRGQSIHFVFSDWCRQIARAEKGRQSRVLGVGNLDAGRDFLHVNDVVRAYNLLLRKGKVGDCYNICSGRTRLLSGYVAFLLKQAKLPIKVRVQKKRMRKFDPPVMKGSAAKLRLLGWSPQDSPFEGLQELFQEWRHKIK